MAQPAPYRPQYDFSIRDVLDTEALDTELAAIETVIDRILENLLLLQRDDGRIANASVHRFALTRSTLALFAQAWEPRGAWADSTDYDKRDMVISGGQTYLCAVDHTSGASFAADLSLEYWMDITGGASVEVPPLPTANGQWVLQTLDGGVNYTWRAETVTGLIGASGLADDAVTTRHIVAGSITATELAAGSVSDSEIAFDSVRSAHVVDNSLQGGDLASGTLTARELAVGAVTARRIGNDAVATANLADGAVTSAKLADGTIAEADLSPAVAAKLNQLTDAQVTTLLSLLPLAALLPLPGPGNWTLANTGGTYSWNT